MKKMKKFIMVTAFFIAVCFMIPSIASAVDVAQVQITRLGMYPGQFGTTDGFMLQIDDLSDTNWTGSRTFYLNDTLGKAGWATVLTAYSMGKTLWVRIVDTTPGSLITIIHIND